MNLEFRISNSERSEERAKRHFELSPNDLISNSVIKNLLKIRQLGLGILRKQNSKFKILFSGACS